MLLIPGFKGLRHSFTIGQFNNQTKDTSDLIARAYADFEYFVREFFPHHCTSEFGQMHRDFMAMESGDPVRRGEKEATAAPRGNAKTTFRALFKAIHAIVYGYHPFIVIIGWSSGEAEDKVKDIRNELIENERLREVYGPLLQKGSSQVDFVTSNGVRVTARGRGGQVRGLKHGPHRPSLIILDDVESLESVSTPEQRAKAFAWFTKDVMGAGSAVGDLNVIFIGTILHEESLLARQLKAPGWLRRKYKAIQSWPERQDLWDQWEALYCDLENDNAADDALAFFQANEIEMMRGVETLWPEGESFYKLMLYKIQYGKASLFSEKQNEPFDPESQILNPDACARFRVYTPLDDDWPAALGDNGFAIVRHDNGKAIHSRDLRIIAFLDPALGKKPTGARGSDPDYAALVVCAQDLSGYIYVLDAWLRKDPPSAQVLTAFDKHAQWGFESLFLETVGFQDLMRQPFAEEQKARPGQPMRIIGVGQHANKHARISTLEPYFSNRWLLFNERMDAEFLGQIRLFPTVHDDGPDALHGCVSRLRRPIGAVTTHGKTGAVT